MRNVSCKPAPVACDALVQKSYGVPGETTLPAMNAGPSTGRVPGPTNCWSMPVVALSSPNVRRCFFGAGDADGDGLATAGFGVAPAGLGVTAGCTSAAAADGP